MMKNLMRYLGVGVLALLFLFGAPAVQAANPVTIANIISVAQLTGGNWSGSPYLNLISYVAGKNKGGGLLHLVASDTTSATNSCTIFVDAVGNRFYREDMKPSAYGCGAIGDNVANDTAPLQSCINSIVNGPITNLLQGAPGGKCDIEAGTFLVTSPLTFGSTSGGNNVGIWLDGAGAGSALLRYNGASGCIIDAFLVDARSEISNLGLWNSIAVAGQCGIDVRANGIVLKNLWINALTGLLFHGSTDVQMDTILCDQCQGPFLSFDASLGVGSSIVGTNLEAFNQASSGQTNTTAVACNGAFHGIVLTNLVASGMSGQGVALANGCQMELNAPQLNAAGDSIGNAGVHRGVDVESGSTLTLNGGTITGWNAEGIFIQSATVLDNGSNIFANVGSASASFKNEVTNIQGSYIKTGGQIIGGHGNETTLVLATGNSNGSLSLIGVNLSNCPGTAIAVNSGSTFIGAITLIGNQISGTNQLNSASATPISLQANVLAGTVSGNSISPANPVTAAISVLSGTVNLTNNMSHFGTFPTTIGTGQIVSTGNQNF